MIYEVDKEKGVAKNLKKNRLQNAPKFFKKSAKDFRKWGFLKDIDYVIGYYLFIICRL